LRLWNTQGWAAYQLEKGLFIKIIPLIKGETCPNMGCNCEFFTMPGFLEVEGLGPLVKLELNAATELIEKWRVIPNSTCYQKKNR
jgi:hypothetical protein